MRQNNSSHADNKRGHAMRSRIRFHKIMALGFGHGSSGLQNSSNVDLTSEQTDVDDITEQCKQRIADLLSGMKVDDVRKLVEEIEQRLQQHRNGKR